MVNLSYGPSPFFRTALMACAVTALVGCGARLSTDPVRNDPRLQHPIQVASQQVSMSFTVPAEGVALAPEDTRRLQGFVRDFALRGRSAVIVESTMSDRARAILLAAGLRANEIALASDTTVKAPMALLTFSANVVQVPACGNWSETYSLNPTNDPTPDLGCSNRHNLGLTVADPGDLIDAQPMSGHGAARSDASVDAYNSGLPFKLYPVPPGGNTQAIIPGGQ